MGAGLKAIKALFGAGGGSAVRDTISGVGDATEKVINAIKGQNPELETAMAELATKANEAQAEINAAEAKHSSRWVSGWRPYIGWIAGTALLNDYIIRPYVNQFTETMIPAIEVGPLLSLLVSMLGVYGVRTYEKKSGIQDQH